MASFDRGPTIDPMSDKAQLSAALLEQFAAIVGREHLLTEASDVAPYLTDWRGSYHGAAQAVLRPASVAEVAAVVALCHEARVPIVPQGGNTGLCGGSVPRASGNEIVCSLSRLNRVRGMDLDNDTMTVEAGCVLANVQAAADEADRLFPLSLASEGSCEIGGNLSTNAGGVAVLRYGNMRELTLGLEVVLADGRVWGGLRGLRKDNTGYDLKQLFIGAEGTLGIITAAVLKLFPKPKSKATALVALQSPRSAVELLRTLRAHCGERLTAFEIMQRICLDLVLAHIPGAVDPLHEHHPWYILAEISDTLPGANLAQVLESSLSEAVDAGIATDAVIASSEAQARALWGLRENISEAQRLEGASIKHDVSVPVSRIPQFIEQANEALSQAFPAIRIVAFGHIGDGNIHYNCTRPMNARNSEFLATQSVVNHIVYDLVASLHGSISAEHGLGQLKRLEIAHYKSAVELQMMKAVKQALDPHDLMNPGKLLP
jgi:FAD/FMN-containing dehydrogenase